MRRRRSCIAGIADIADHVAGVHEVAFTERREVIEVRVVVPLESRSDDAHKLPAEMVRSDPRHDAARGTDDGRAFWREEIDSFMRTAAWPWRGP